MRLFPSFDFLDFDDLNAGISPPEADAPHAYHQNNNNSNNNNNLYNPSMNYSINITNNSNTIIRSADTLTTNNQQTNNAFGLQQQTQQQPMEYTELSTFNTLNTLATVAAQSPHLNNQEIQYTAANTQTKVNFVVSSLLVVTLFGFILNPFFFSTGHKPIN